jgi:hypothetical protein
MAKMTPRGQGDGVRRSTLPLTAVQVLVVQEELRSVSTAKLADGSWNPEATRPPGVPRDARQVRRGPRCRHRLRPGLGRCAPSAPTVLNV